MIQLTKRPPVPWPPGPWVCLGLHLWFWTHHGTLCSQVSSLYKVGKVTNLQCYWLVQSEKQKAPVCKCFGKVKKDYREMQVAMIATTVITDFAMWPVKLTCFGVQNYPRSITSDTWWKSTPNGASVVLFPPQQVLSVKFCLPLSSLCAFPDFCAQSVTPQLKQTDHLTPGLLSRWVPTALVYFGGHSSVLLLPWLTNIAQPRAAAFQRVYWFQLHSALLFSSVYKKLSFTLNISIQILTYWLI